MAGRCCFFLQSCLLTFLMMCSNLFIKSTDAYKRPQAGRNIITPHQLTDSDPQQVHVSLAGKDHVKVSWITNDKHVPSVVDYGTNPGEYNASATGVHQSYRYIFYKSGRIHHVKIGPLNPKTKYYYRCGGQGLEFELTTPPSSYPIEFVVVGDLGQTEWTQSTLTQVSKKDYDVFLFPGDLSYADTNQPLWDSFGRLVEPYASQRMWMVTEGNHEIESFPILHPQTFKAYNARWPMPFKESGSSSNLYYSFDVVGAHIIMLGSYTDFDVKSDQYKWLQADLAKVDRSVTPWLIVLLHAPWYNTNLAHKGEGESMRKAMENILYKARVDIVFSGHVHAYERFTRIYDNKADPSGPIYITIGDGGNREGLAREFEKLKNPSLSLFREASFGHGRLKIISGKHAHWSWHRNDDEVSNVADEILIENLAGMPNTNNIVGDENGSTFINDEL
ncbi:unnamed protein product [Rhodiola kirilowii]